MKPFLGIDLTTDQQNEQPAGEEFLIATPSEALCAALDRSTEQMEETLESSRLPRIFRILQFIAAAVTLVILAGILQADLPVKVAYKNAPWLFWLAGVCAVAWVVLLILGRRKARQVLDAPESKQAAAHVDRAAEEIFCELGIPKKARDVDLLTFFYKMQDGEMKLKTQKFQIAPYINPTYKIFLDKENLYLANLEGKYAFPLASLTALRTVKKHIRLLSWNKEQGPRSDTYKPYRLSMDHYGCVHCHSYAILEVVGESETWGIYIPCYEVPVFEKLTGLRATEEE